MKAQELIKELEKYPKDTPVCIVDWKKSVNNSDDEPSSIGIESNFKVNLENVNVNKPFISIAFDNNDF